MSRQLSYVFDDTAALQVVAPVGTPPGSADVGTRVDAVSPGFFSTLGIPLLFGRDIEWTDDANTRTVVVVSTGIAERLFGSDDPIGRRVRVGTAPSLQDAEIVGVVGETALGSLRSPSPAVFRAWLQSGTYGRYPVIQLRVDRAIAGTGESVGRAIESLGTEFVMQSRTVRDQMSHALGQERVAALLSSLLGALALAMALIGLYARLAYAVARRTREFGVRMAMGASRTRVAGLIMADALTVTAHGVALGVPLALALGQMTGAFLYGVTPSDPLTLGVVVASFIAVGSAAALAPALRAARTSPMDCLRSE